jgi:hypothetical protein
MLPLKKIVFLSIYLTPSWLFAVSYDMSASLPNTIVGPNGFTFTVTAANPFNMSNGDTLTIDNASLGGGISLNTGQYLIGLPGNNTVTVNSAESITATFNAGNSGYVFNPTGNNSSTIIIQSGATIQTTGTNSALYNPTSSVQSIMVQNYGALNTTVPTNLLNSSPNSLAFCGTFPPTATGALNSGASVGNSYLYIGGYVVNNVDQMEPTTLTYSNPDVLNPFFYARVMAGSTFNLQADIPVATTLAYNTWVVDSNATLNLQLSTATANESLTTDNFRNYGSTIMASGANAKIITVNNYLNAGVLEITGANANLNGFGTTPIIGNNSTGIIIIGSSASAIIQNFSLFTNSGSVTNSGRIYNISGINNNAGGVFSLDTGSIYDTIGTINNAAHAIMNFNGATSANNADLVLTNSGTVNFQAGDFGALNLINNGIISITGGTIGKTLALTTSVIDNNAQGQITGTVGQIGASGQNYVPLLRNYGQISLNNIPVVVTTFANYGSFSQANANLTVTNFTNPLGASLSINAATTVSLGASINNYGNISLTSVGTFSSVIENYGSVNVAGTTAMQAVTNYQDFTIAANTTYNAGVTVFTNNGNLEILGATLTLSSITNAENASITLSGSNTLNGAINNSGIVTMSGTMNHNGTYDGNNTSALVINNPTDYIGTNPLTQNGALQFNINSIEGYSQLVSNQNISLANCDLIVNVDQSLIGTYQFTILQVTGGKTITTAPNEFNNIDNFLYTL